MERRLVVLYASQTGTAKDVAERVARDARRRRFRVFVSAMDDYDRTRLIDEAPVIFVCATMGDGEEPDNMKAFWKFLLRKSWPRDILSNLEYTVFALGDSSYDKFNYPGKKLHKRLQQLGARPFYPKGEGDDQHYLGVDGTLDPWLDGLWQVLLQRFPLPPGQEIISDQELLPPKYRLVPYEGKSTAPTTRAATLGTIAARVECNTRMTTPDHFQDVRHVVLSIDQGVRYRPGDIARLMPSNSAENVDALLSLIGWTAQADDLVLVESTDPDSPVPADIPQPTTLRALLTHHLSPWSRPRRYLFELLSHFATDDQQREKLVEFCTAAGQDELYSYCHRPRRHCVEVIQDFFAVRNVPAAYCFDLFPEMIARDYSLASFAKGKVELCVAVVEYKTKLAAPRRGIASEWIRALKEGDAVPLRIVPGTMTLPDDANTPIICIGPGTGVAPMKSLIEARIQQGATANLLIFGCRSKAHDFLFETEWQKHVDAGNLDLWTAFSRDQPAKVYVQHVLLQHGPQVFDWIHDRGAHVYVCGSSNQMPTDVRNALTLIVQNGAGLTHEQAAEYVARMKKARRYQEETWS
ncbi:NADPH-dependent diflavin oxidoreductase 1 [Allomyces arbusculus]|nr:NADPH-dependent diflavin oxidoreductase 1 [Allomyces arbusculus]